jgi:biopolymer transport protein ExbB/TolQ
MQITEQFLKLALLGAEWVMYILVACSVVSIGIIFERIFFFLKLKDNFPEFLQKLTERLNSGDSTESIAAWCSGQSSIPSKVAGVGLEKISKNPKAAEDAMSATLISSRVLMDRGITILATLASNTPYIGLFGTIIGIIQAFNALATSTSSGPEVVMASISEALVATAVGLMVAIPALIATNFLSRKIKTIMAQGETTIRVVLSSFGQPKSN